MEHNSKIVWAIVLSVIAGALFGYGVGAYDQYKTTEKFLIQQADSGDPIILNGEGGGQFMITRSNLTWADKYSIPANGGK